MPKICPICERSYSDDNAFCPVDGTTLRADVTGDLIGSVIADRYLITDLLGEGGMGRVYLGRHVRLPQQAAIKVLRPDLVKDTASISRFNREATSTSRIQSEYVARVFDFGETQDNLVYLAMEYVPGRTLRALVESEGPLPLPRTAAIISQIAEGLDAAHRLGIVHRDLKPDNVIITQDDEVGDRAKVVDFGIAKAIGGEKQGQITSTGFVVGTPDYMSPEQLLSENVDARSDVYALGLVAYNMLTGALPFTSTTPSQGLMARLVDAPAPLSQSNPRGMWSMQVQQVFDTVLAREVNARYATVREFAHALREAAGLAIPIVGTRATSAVSTAGSYTNARQAAPTVSSTTSSTAPTTAKARSNKLVVIGASAVALAGVAAVALFLQNGASSNGAGDTTVPPVSQLAAPDTVARPNSPPSTAGDASQSAIVPVAPSGVASNANAAPDNASRTAVDGGRGNSERAPGDARGSNAGGASGTATVPVTRTPTSAPITASIDSVMRAVDQLLELTDDAAIPVGARVQIQRIDQLLRRAPTSGDSARLFFLSGNASKLAGDDKGACAALRLAGRLSLSAGDKRAADRYHQQWGCDSPWR